MHLNLDKCKTTFLPLSRLCFPRESSAVFIQSTQWDGKNVTLLKKLNSWSAQNKDENKINAPTTWLSPCITASWSVWPPVAPSVPRTAAWSLRGVQPGWCRGLAPAFFSGLATCKSRGSRAPQGGLPSTVTPLTEREGDSRCNTEWERGSK